MSGSTGWGGVSIAPGPTTTTRSGGPAARAIGTPSAPFAGSSGSSCEASRRSPIPAPVEAIVDAFTRTFRRLVETSPEAELALGALGRLRELGAVDAVVPLDEFWILLEAVLAAPSAAGSEPAAGRVFVGELGTALGIDFALTIVPGLVEGGFPAAPRQDPILLDAERRRLTGLPLAAEARELERVRFALAVGSGARRVAPDVPAHRRGERAAARAVVPRAGSAGGGDRPAPRFRDPRAVSRAGGASPSTRRLPAPTSDRSTSASGS